MVGLKDPEPLPPLGGVEGVGLLGDLKGSLAAEVIQGLVEVHGDAVLFIEMEIELLDLPDAVFLGGGGEHGLVGGGLHRFPAVLAHQLVARVPVFALDVMGDDHLRLEASDLPGELFGEAIVVLHLDDKEHGQGPDPAVPEAVEGLPVPLLLGHVAIDHLDLQAPFGGVGGEDAAHHDQLVVRVAGDQHDVALFGSHLPQMDVVRHVGGVVHMPFRQPAAAAAVAADHFEDDAPGPFGHGEIPPVPLPIADAGADGLPVLVHKGIPALVGGHDPLPVYDAHGHVRGPVDARLAAFSQVRAGLVSVVHEADGIVAETRPVGEVAFFVEYGVFVLRQSHSRRRDQEQERQEKTQ